MLSIASIKMAVLWMKTYKCLGFNISVYVMLLSWPDPFLFIPTALACAALGYAASAFLFSDCNEMSRNSKLVR